MNLASRKRSHIPPNGKAGKSSTQECLEKGDMLVSRGTFFGAAFTSENLSCAKVKADHRLEIEDIFVRKTNNQKKCRVAEFCCDRFPKPCNFCARLI